MPYYFIIFLCVLFFDDQLHSKEFIVLQSTTSTRDSGFYDYLLPKFLNKSGFDVRVVAVGTGQAIRNIRNCDGDVLIAHNKESEDKLVSDGFGIYRKEFMFNDYVLVGPRDDPALINKNISIKDALKQIVESKSLFITRGDNSGTYMKEIKLWKSINLIPNPRIDEWYLSVGQGMGGALNIAVNKNAYILSDRATWESFKNKKDHDILVSNEPLLLNFYGVIPISSKKCSNAKEILSRIFVEWLISDETKNLINNFKVNDKQLFHPVE
tara:strand:- start:806 stop:1609 length:804 start_codon:yes stop_codon:yes gene_type:complete